MKRILIFVLWFWPLARSFAGDPAITDLAKVDAHYAYIGEYTAQTQTGRSECAYRLKLVMNHCLRGSIQEVCRAWVGNR